MFTAIGSKVMISMTFGAPKNVSAISNTDPAVATSAAHGFSAGKEVLMYNGWDDVTDSVLRVGPAPDANTFKLADLDTSDTDWYPQGAASAGTAREVTDWFEIGNITNLTSEGGGARTIDVRIMSRRNAISLPAGFESSKINLELAFDPKRVDQRNLDKISRKLSQRVAVKILVPGGATIYGYGFIQKGAMPKFNLDDILKVDASLSILGTLMVYVDD